MSINPMYLILGSGNSSHHKPITIFSIAKRYIIQDDIYGSLHKRYDTGPIKSTTKNVIEANIAKLNIFRTHLHNLHNLHIPQVQNLHHYKDSILYYNRLCLPFVLLKIQQHP